MVRERSAKPLFAGSNPAAASSRVYPFSLNNMLLSFLISLEPFPYSVTKLYKLFDFVQFISGLAKPPLVVNRG